MHCKEFLEMDFPNVNPKNLLAQIQVAKITYVPIPFETVLDYTCLITLENTAEKGGYRFLPHNSMIGTSCCPVYVFSEEGYNELLNGNPICPICYARVSAANFERANPKPLVNDELNVFGESTVNVFDDNHKNYSKPVNLGVVNNVVNPSVNNNANLKFKENGFLIILKGTTGVGKSTFSAKLQEAYEAQNKHFFVAGTDAYCKDGDTMQQAIEKIKQNLLTINDIPDDGHVIVCIDTCNEHTSNKTNDIFGVNFAGWKRINVWPNLIDRNNLNGYLSWSLRNVLNREATTSESKYWLNPVNAGVSTCIMVHKKKAVAHFGKKIPELFYGSPATKEKALELIKDEADKYALLLESTKPLDLEIQKIVQG